MILLTRPMLRFEDHPQRTAPDRDAAFQNALLKKEIEDYRVCLDIQDLKVRKELLLFFIELYQIQVLICKTVDFIASTIENSAYFILSSDNPTRFLVS